MNETELTTLLERGSRLHEPDVDALVAGGAARGRRSLRRRRVGTVTLSALATAGIATGSLLLAGGGITPTDASLPVASSGTEVSPATTSSDSTRIVHPHDGNGPVEVTAELRSIPEIHADIQRVLGPGTSDLLRGLSGPVSNLDGDDLSWFFRFDDAEAQASISPVPYGCGPSGEEVAHQTGCLTTDDGVDYRTAGPWRNDGPNQWGQTVVSWQHGFEIMVISTNIHEEISEQDYDVTVVADQPTITLDQLVDLATSDIWFEPTGD